MLLTIDSSVFISSLDMQDSHYWISRRFIGSIRKRRVEIVLPILVPLEVVHTIQRYGASPERRERLYRSFFENPRIRIVPLDGSVGSRLFERFETLDLKTSDWIIAGISFLFGCQLVTWDDKLLRKTKKMLSSQTPQEWLKTL